MNKGYEMEQSVIDRIVQTTGDIPAMPQVANMVLDRIADPNATPKEIQLIISKDQALAARVLKVANSSFYGLSRSVTRISDAIVVMGFNSLRSLVMTTVMNDLFKSFGLTEKLLWEHSLVSAATAKRIASAIRFSKVEECFLAGLMHDIGKVILNIKMPEKTLTIVQEVYNSEGATTFTQVEETIFGFTHAEVGRLVARKWNFAEEIEEAIGYHHKPAEASVMPALSHVVNLANAVCHKLEIGPTRNPGLDLHALDSTRALKLEKDRLDELLEEISGIAFSQQGGISIF